MDLVKYVMHPIKYAQLLEEKILSFLPDEPYLKMLYKHRFGKKLDLDNPTTYNEKLQWLKLNDRNPLYTTLVDKYLVKQYVAHKIGDKYIIPLLGVWDSFDEIDFDKLPNQFVLKTNHGCGGIVICKDKNQLNIDNARKIINKSLKFNYYKKWREWPYKNVEKKIIAEQYMVDECGVQLKDYKFYCFNGRANIMLIATDRNIGVKFDYFDMNFNHLDIRTCDNTNKILNKPKNFDKMKELAEILSENFPTVRVDFYDINGQIYFGEITFYDAAGFEDKFQWDKPMGDMIDLSRAYNLRE